jgi:ribose transport system substrate-binding protein
MARLPEERDGPVRANTLRLRMMNGPLAETKTVCACGLVFVLLFVGKFNMMREKYFYSSIFGAQMKKIIPLLLIPVLLLAACAQITQEEQSASAAASATESSVKEKYIAIYSMAGYDYFTDHKMGFMRAGEELGVDTEYIGPDENNIEAMKDCFLYAISEQAAGIVVFGAGDSLRDMIDTAAGAGIPVVTVDGDIKDSQRIAFVGTDNEAAGETGGEELVKMMGRTGEVAILTEPGVDLHRERTQGYRNILDQYVGISVVAEEDTKANPDDAYAGAMNAIQNNPGLDAIVCTDYFGGSAAAIAVEETDNVGRITIIAMDRSSYVLEKIGEGVIAATLVQQTALMPYYALRILYDYNHPAVTVVSDKEAAGITGVPVYIDTGVFVVTRDNYTEFIRN